MTRTSPTRLLGMGMVAATATVLFAGCAYLVPPKQFTDSETFDADVRTIRIDEPSGSVTVRGDADTTTVQLTRTVTYRGAREVGATFELSGGVLVLSGCGSTCSVDYEIEVPLGVDVRGETSNGSIELRGVGEVEVESSNGSIELVDVTGDVDVETSNGRIEGRGLAGTEVNAQTSNGSIDLRLAAAQDVEARSSNGSVRVEVPTDGATYRVRAESSNGSIDVGITDDPDGEFELDLSTSNGSIGVSRGR